MIKISVQEIKHIDFTKSMFTPAEIEILLKLIAKKMIERFNLNVEMQVIWDGKSISKNSPYWQAYKQSMGFDLRSLVMKDRSFLKETSWKVTMQGNNTILVEMGSDLYQKFLGIQTIDKAVGKNYEYVAPTKLQLEQLIYLVMDKAIKEKCDKINKGG